MFGSFTSVSNGGHGCHYRPHQQNASRRADRADALVLLAYDMAFIAGSLAFGVGGAVE
jgi:hypothetical protein